MTRRMTRVVVFVVASAALVVFIGCGGGSDRGIDTAPGVAATGLVTVSVTWPEPAEMEPQLIPQLSERIDVQIVDAATEGVLVSDSIGRPETEPWTVEKTYEGVPASGDAILTGTGSTWCLARRWPRCR